MNPQLPIILAQSADSAKSTGAELDAIVANFDKLKGLLATLSPLLAEAHQAVIQANPADLTLTHSDEVVEPQPVETKEEYGTEHSN